MARSRVPGEGRFERLDVSHRGVLIAGAAMAALALAFGVLALAIVALLDPDRPAPPPISGHLERGGPLLSVTPEKTLADTRRRHAARLEEHAWIDRESGLARIPIDTAMRLLAERGWPTPPPDGPPEALHPDPARRAPPPQEEPPR